MNVLLLRHTRVAIPAGLCYGWTDVPLAASFADEAAAVKNALPWTPDEIRSSPAARCRQLAATLTADPVHIEPRLAEMHMGEWENRRWDELSGPVHQAWMADPWGTRAPGGENSADLLARVAALRDEILGAKPERLLLVRHAGVIRAWRSLAENRPLPDLFNEPVPFGSLTEAR